MMIIFKIFSCLISLFIPKFIRKITLLQLHLNSKILSLYLQLNNICYPLLFQFFLLLQTFINIKILY